MMTIIMMMVITRMMMVIIGMVIIGMMMVIIAMMIKINFLSGMMGIKNAKPRKHKLRKS